MTDKKTVKFGDICHEVRLTTKDPIGDGYERYIGLEHLDSGSLKIKRWGLIVEDSPSFTRVFKKGQILFGKRRPYLKKAAVAEFDGICSGDIIVMEPKGDDLLLGLLPFVVQSDKFWDWAIQNSSGSLSPRTKFKSLAEQIISVPNAAKQINLLSILVKKEDLLSILTSTITTTNDSVRVLLQDFVCSKSTEKSVKKSIPEGWKLKKLSDVATYQHGKAFPSSEYGSKGAKLLRPGNESPPVCRRLIFLRGLAHEQTTRIFKRSTRTCS